MRINRARLSGKICIMSKEVLTFNEAAEYTGYSRSYLRKLTSGGIIPHSKPNGKSIFFELRKLNEWLLRNPRKGLQEMQQNAAHYISTH